VPGADCDKQTQFCLGGVVSKFDPNAVVIWSDSYEGDLQQLLNMQYILHSDRCGCSQVQHTACAPRVHA